MSKELLFVYNTTSGFPHAMIDALHKTFSPQTYACHLCKITYGHLSMKKEWRAFLDQLPLHARFLYKNEWKARYQRDDKLPAIFIREDENLSVLVDSKEIGKLTLGELMQVLTEVLNQSSNPDEN